MADHGVRLGFSHSVRLVACAALSHRTKELVAQRRTAPGLERMLRAARRSLVACITPVFGLPWFPRKFGATFRAVLPIDFHLNVIVYWLIVGVQHSAGYYRRFLDRERLSAQLELRATQLESQLAQAKLSALKMQLRPQFLFNTLNAIVVLVRQHRAEEADAMLTNLSELLRQTLAGLETQEVPLRRELELINLYLDIQRVRFPDRLTVETNLSPATLNALVPSLLLQPLVENAVRHGVSKTSAPGPDRIEILREGLDSGAAGLR